MSGTADAVPGYRLHGLLRRRPGRRLHRAEALGQPGRPLLIEVHDVQLDGAELEGLRRQTAAVRDPGHPSILPVLEVVELHEGVALVMPAAVGGSLGDAPAATAGARLTEEIIDAVRDQVTEALHHAHERGVHHGAITAEMVRFDAQGRALLMGLGTRELRGAARHDADNDAADRDRHDLARLLDTYRTRGASELVSERGAADPHPLMDPHPRPNTHPGRHPSPDPGLPTPTDQRATTDHGQPAVRHWLVIAAVVVLVTPILLVTLAVTSG